MKQHNLTQGSTEWHELRSKYMTASEAPAMMGLSKYTSRQQLLKQKHTGLTPEVSDQQQRIFNKGHEAEAAARAIAEEIIGEELYPVTGTEEVHGIPLLASFDGLTMMEDVVWEHKLINEELRTATVETLAEHYKVQMDQQLLVSGASKCLFMASDGTKDDCNWFWYESTPDRKADLVQAWEQFLSDLSVYQPEPEAKPVTGAAQETLPALRINLTGMVTASNLHEFKAQALARIDAIKTDLVTDQDFADAEVTVKFLKGGEKQLEDAKAKALADTVTIDDLFRTVDDLKEQMRQKRLLLEKLVKTEKENRRISILNEGNKAFAEWMAAQESPVPLHLDAGIAEAMKGKKSIKGLEDAAADAVASAKIAAKKEIDRLKDNLSTLKDLAGEYEYLFSDWAQLIQKDQDFLVLHIKQTISDHQQREQAKLDAERERIRQEEEARAKAEAQAKAEADCQREEVKQTTEAPKSLEVSALIKKASEIGHPEQVSISKKEYDQLMRDSALLQALIAAGVDNWSGYSDAYAAAFHAELSV